MNIYTYLDELQQKAMHSNEIKELLLSSQNDANPLQAFCRTCRELGYPIYEMELVTAGEEMYDEMKRSTNGGGANSPMLEGQNDLFELFIASLK